jgi:hypothetical protein
MQKSADILKSLMTIHEILVPENEIAPEFGYIRGQSQRVFHTTSAPFRKATRLCGVVRGALGARASRAIRFKLDYTENRRFHHSLPFFKKGNDEQ